MVCKYTEPCAANVGTKHWCCLQKLHRELTELRKEQRRLEYVAREKMVDIDEFYPATPPQKQERNA